MNIHEKNLTLPGRIRFFKISVPVADAFIKQILAPSKAPCPWSPHNLTKKKHLSIFNKQSSKLVGFFKFFFDFLYPNFVKLHNILQEKKQKEWGNFKELEVWDYPVVPLLQSNVIITFFLFIRICLIRILRLQFMKF